MRLIALLTGQDKMTNVIYQEGRSSTPAVGGSSGSSNPPLLAAGCFTFSLPQRQSELRFVREMNGRGASVDFVKENTSFTTGSEDPRSTQMFTILSAFAQFERSLIREKQRELTGQSWQKSLV